MNRIACALFLVCIGWTNALANASVSGVMGRMTLLNDQLSDAEGLLLAQGYADMEDVVYLKNGSVIRGMVIEQIPMQQLKIQTKDGSVFVFKMDEIDKIAKEKVFGLESDTNRTKGKSLGYGRDKLRSPGGAFVLSFLILPGIGQYYNGAYIPKQHIKGVVFTLVHVVGFSLMVAGISECALYVYGDCPAGMIWGGWLMTAVSRWWSSADAAIVAGKINRREYDLEEVNTNKLKRYDDSAELTIAPMFRVTDSPLKGHRTPTYGVQAAINF